jgi:hypothetical protein
VPRPCNVRESHHAGHLFLPRVPERPNVRRRSVNLLKLIRHSGAVPGALGKDDVEPALKRLEAAIEAHERSPEGEPSAEGDDSEEGVSLSQRAWPLIQLLKAAARQESYVM